MGDNYQAVYDREIARRKRQAELTTDKAARKEEQ